MELLSADYLVPVSEPPIANGAMVVDLDRILAVGTLDALRTQYPGIEEHHFAGHVLMPGLVNAHVQPDLSRFFPPEIPERTKEGDLCLHTHWQKHALHYAQETRLDKVADSVEFCLRRLSQYGVTTAGISSNYEGCINMLERSGLRAVLFPQVFASSSTDMTQDRFESALALLDKYLDRSALIRIGINPVAPYLLSRQLLMILAQHAQEYGVPTQIRAAESFEEMEFFFNSSGPIGSDIFPLLGWGHGGNQPLPPAFQKTPIQYLQDIGLLDASPSVVGCMHLRATDYDYLAQSKSVAIYTPRAIQTFMLGEFPYGRLQEAGVTVALGTKPGLQATDGDLWEEMRTALNGGGIPAADILRMGTLGGACALQTDCRTGSLEAEKQADYLVIETPPHPDPHFLVDSIIRHTTPNRIHRVVVAGQILKTV